MDSIRKALANQPDLPVTVAAVLLQVVVFAIDAVSPLGYAVWILHSWAVVLATFQNQRLLPWLLAALGVLFTTAGVPLSPDFNVMNISAVIFNRAAGCATFVAIAIIVSQVIARRMATQNFLWMQQSENQLAQALSGDLVASEIGERASGVIAERLGAALAVTYLKRGDALIRLGGHGIDESRQPERLQLGEGLPGQVCRDGQHRIVSALPGRHLPIRSGLGESEPAHLVLLPLSADAQTLGVIELGFTGAAPDAQRIADFTPQVGEVVAIALRAALFREERLALLAETQQQAEELQTQQEELRVSNEELEEQSRVLRESQAALETQQTELERANAQIASHAHNLEHRQRALLESQQALAERGSALETANRYKSEFLANMSHELRTPLNSALILSRLLMENREAHLDDEEVRFAKAIHDSNNDLLLLINDILDLSKIEAGHADLQHEKIVVEQTCQRLHDTIAPLAQQKGLGFVIERLPDTPEHIETDGLRLQQILKNLLSNAVKFTATGTVTLRLRPGRIEAPGSLGVDVIDTGMGIPLDKQDIIFEAFRQADGSTNRQFGGTGLGLSISRELALRMGGCLRVESAPGRGSTFSLDLPPVLPARAGSDATVTADEARPVAPEPGTARARTPATMPQPALPATSPASAVAPTASPRRLSGRRVVLAVEDDSAFADVLQQLVEEMDFDCVVASSGAEALELARELSPLGVLLDIGLPDVSGLSVLERLKRDPTTRHIPVHLISAVERNQAALEMGAIGHVVKPALREELVAAVARLRERAETALRRVLVVEDDPLLRENLQRLLAGPNTEILTAGSVAEALESLSQHTFDCMVTDLALPDASGFELLERMAADPAHSFPPVIVYTGRMLSRDEETRLRRYSRSIIVKGARSPERLLDEVTLFLHSVESTLPAEQQRLLQSARKRDAILEGRRILLAEDDVRNIFALTSVLEPLGVTLEIARNGREALERLAREPAIDLVLMDIMMPEMDGLTALRRMRENRAWADIPVISLTAKAMADDRQQCLEAGANDYLAKPLDVDRLISLCRVWMPK